MDLEKPKLNREVLKSHGITFEDEIISNTLTQDDQKDKKTLRLPDHVESLREALLNLDGELHRWVEDHFKEELHENPIISVADEERDDVKHRHILPPVSAFIKRGDSRARRSRYSYSDNKERVEESSRMAKEPRNYTKDIVSEAEWAHLMRTHAFRTFKHTNPSATECE